MKSCRNAAQGWQLISDAGQLSGTVPFDQFIPFMTCGHFKMAFGSVVWIELSGFSLDTVPHSIELNAASTIPDDIGVSEVDGALAEYILLEGPSPTRQRMSEFVETVFRKSLDADGVGLTVLGGSDRKARRQPRLISILQEASA